jgi:hypothetical protein
MILPSKQFWQLFKKTSGALSCCEAIAITNIAAQTPPGEGIFLEVGTYHGKSAMAAAYGLPQGYFHLVDPIFDDRSLAENVQTVVLDIGNDLLGVGAINSTSLDEIPKESNYRYVFVDSGSHGDGLPMAEVKLLEDRMAPGGIVAFHDLFSQFVEVEQAYNYLLSTGKYEPISINWEEIKNHVRENNIEQGNDSWHHTEMDFPCFVGALKRKSN